MDPQKNPKRNDFKNGNENTVEVRVKIIKARRISFEKKRKKIVVITKGQQRKINGTIF